LSAISTVTGRSAPSIAMFTHGLEWGREPFPPPAPSPSLPPAIDLNSPAAQATFAVACGVAGLVFAFVGQRVWRTFLACSALAVAGGATFYLLITGSPDLPIWGDGIIAACVGLVAAGVATFFALLGLLVCSGAAGFLAAWFVLRATGLAAELDKHMSHGHVVMLAGCAAITMVAVLVCQCGCCRRSKRGRSASLTKSRRSGSAKLGEALITSIIGAYGVLFCVEHWLDDDSNGLSPTDIASADVPSRCVGECAGLLGGFVGLACLGFLAQALCIRGQERGRQLEDDALRQPLDSSTGYRRESRDAARGRETALASRIRFKYFRSSSSRSRDSPVNSQTRQDLDSYLTDAAERREQSRSRGWGLRRA
tara:strand:- start:215 stop:1315 length:1101 start_codon:yes stop_codon:yes gene_type:complete